MADFGDMQLKITADIGDTISKINQLRQANLQLAEETKHLSAQYNNNAKELRVLENAMKTGAGLTAQSAVRVDVLRAKQKQLGEAIVFNKGLLKESTTAIASYDKSVIDAAKASTGFAGGISKAYTGLKSLANIIPGLGIAGLVGLIAGPLVDAFSEWFDSMNSVSKLLKNINEEAAKTFGGSVGTIDILKKKLDDLTIPQKERIAIAKEYNKLADAGNQIDLTQINNLDLLNAKIAAQIKLLKERAFAKAAENIVSQKAEALFKAQIDFEIDFPEGSEEKIKNLFDRVTTTIQQAQKRIGAIGKFDTKELLALIDIPEDQLRQMNLSNNKLRLLLDSRVGNILKNTERELKAIEGYRSGLKAGGAGIAAAQADILRKQKDFDQTLQVAAGLTTTQSLITKDTKEKTVRDVETIADVLAKLGRQKAVIDIDINISDVEKAKAKIQAIQSAIKHLIDSFKLTAQSPVIIDLQAEIQDINLREQFNKVLKGITGEKVIVPFEFQLGNQQTAERLAQKYKTDFANAIKNEKFQFNLELHPNFVSSDIENQAEIEFLKFHKIFDVLQHGKKISIEGVLIPDLHKVAGKIKKDVDDLKSALNSLNTGVNFDDLNEQTLHAALGIATILTPAINDFFDTLTSGGGNAFASFGQAIGKMIKQLVTAALKAIVLGAILAAITGKPFNIQAILGKTFGFAEGGHVRGPGSKTSDSIPARLSDNEYVIKARSVDKFGVKFFDKLNAGKLPDVFTQNTGKVVFQTYAPKIEVTVKPNDEKLISHISDTSSLAQSAIKREINNSKVELLKSVSNFSLLKERNIFFKDSTATEKTLVNKETHTNTQTFVNTQKFVSNLSDLKIYEKSITKVTEGGYLKEKSFHSFIERFSLVNKFDKGRDNNKEKISTEKVLGARDITKEKSKEFTANNIFKNGFTSIKDYLKDSKSLVLKVYKGSDKAVYKFTSADKKLPYAIDQSKSFTGLNTLINRKEKITQSKESGNLFSSIKEKSKDFLNTQKFANSLTNLSKFYEKITGFKSENFKSEKAIEFLNQGRKQNYDGAHLSGEISKQPSSFNKDFIRSVQHQIEYFNKRNVFAETKNTLQKIAERSFELVTNLAKNKVLSSGSKENERSAIFEKFKSDEKLTSNLFASKTTEHKDSAQLSPGLKFSRNLYKHFDSFKNTDFKAFLATHKASDTNTRSFSLIAKNLTENNSHDNISKVQKVLVETNIYGKTHVKELQKEVLSSKILTSILNEAKKSNKDLVNKSDSSLSQNFISRYFKTFLDSSIKDKAIVSSFKVLSKDNLVRTTNDINASSNTKNNLKEVFSSNFSNQALKNISFRYKEAEKSLFISSLKDSDNSKVNERGLFKYSFADSKNLKLTDISKSKDLSKSDSRNSQSFISRFKELFNVSDKTSSGKVLTNEIRATNDKNSVSKNSHKEIVSIFSSNALKNISFKYKDYLKEGKIRYSQFVSEKENRLTKFSDNKLTDRANIYKTNFTGSKYSESLKELVKQNLFNKEAKSNIVKYSFVDTSKISDKLISLQKVSDGKVFTLKFSDFSEKNKLSEKSTKENVRHSNTNKVSNSVYNDYFKDVISDYFKDVVSKFSNVSFKEKLFSTALKSFKDIFKDSRFVSSLIGLKENRLSKFSDNKVLYSSRDIKTISLKNTDFTNKIFKVSGKEGILTKNHFSESSKLITDSSRTNTIRFENIKSIAGLNKIATVISGSKIANKMFLPLRYWQPSVLQTFKEGKKFNYVVRTSDLFRSFRISDKNTKISLSDFKIFSDRQKSNETYSRLSSLLITPKSGELNTRLSKFFSSEKQTNSFNNNLSSVFRYLTDKLKENVFTKNNFSDKLISDRINSDKTHTVSFLKSALRIIENVKFLSDNKTKTLTDRNKYFASKTSKDSVFTKNQFTQNSKLSDNKLEKIFSRSEKTGNVSFLKSALNVVDKLHIYNSDKLNKNSFSEKILKSDYVSNKSGFGGVKSVFSGFGGMSLKNAKVFNSGISAEKSLTRAAGVFVLNTDGAPGGNTTIRVRGKSIISDSKVSKFFTSEVSSISKKVDNLLSNTLKHFKESSRTFTNNFKDKSLSNSLKEVYKYSGLKDTSLIKSTAGLKVNSSSVEKLNSYFNSKTDKSFSGAAGLLSSFTNLSKSAQLNSKEKFYSLKDAGVKVFSNSIEKLNKYFNNSSKEKVYENVQFSTTELQSLKDSIRDYSNVSLKYEKFNTGSNKSSELAKYSKEVFSLKDLGLKVFSSFEKLSNKYFSNSTDKAVNSSQLKSVYKELVANNFTDSEKLFVHKDFSKESSYVNTSDNTSDKNFTNLTASLISTIKTIDKSRDKTYDKKLISNFTTFIKDKLYKTSSDKSYNVSSFTTDKLIISSLNKLVFNNSDSSNNSNSVHNLTKEFGHTFSNKLVSTFSNFIEKISNNKLLKYASGGFVQGPGSKTSDSVLIRASRGEYVIKAAAVEKYGVGLFDRLNAGAIPSNIFKNIFNSQSIKNIDISRTVNKIYNNLPRFATGGLVGDSIITRPIGNIRAGSVVQVFIPKNVIHGKDLVTVFNRANQSISNNS